MHEHVMRYKGYIIDFTPSEVRNGVFRPRWTIVKDDAVWAGSVPLSSGMMIHQCTFDQSCAIGKAQAMRMIDYFPEKDIELAPEKRIPY